MENKKFNENQLEAITYDKKKPLLIEAGPGAGKTFVLIERVKFLIKEKQVNPESLLVITFTEKAAEELKNRLNDDADIGPEMINKMQISTIHSFCYKIVSEYGFSGIEVLADNFNTGGEDVNELMNLFLRKHMDDLGFTYEYYINKGQIDSVINKFNEYSTFEVDTPGLIQYIKENRPISQEYLDLIEKTKVECAGGPFIFPYNTVHEDKDLNKSWYNAKYLAIAKAYPKYKELLEKEGVLDYNFLQIKALNLLKDSEIINEIDYKNILVDEFQDTDPIQMQIFETLMPQADSFTVVGDDDQSIYRFRGAIPKFFNEFPKKYDANVVTLQTNYRSTPDIVDFNEHFIKKYRPENSGKQLQANRDKRTTIYYLENKDKEEQATNIAEIIYHLKATGKIKQFSDVGILMRSTSGKIDEIINQLHNKDIPFSFSSNLIDQDEIKSIITLLWYLNGSHNPTICTSWEQEWLNLNAFTDKIFNSSDMFNLSSQTMRIFSDLEDKYEQEVLETEHIVCKEFNNRNRGKSCFAKVFDREQEMLDEIFRRINKPEISEMDVDELKNLGITNEHDLNFFKQLQKIKKEFWNPDDVKNRLSILDVYYKLLNLNNYLDNKFNSKNIVDKQKIQNIALLTNTIYNYENMIYKYGLNGLFWYLNGNLNKYSTPILDENLDTVQILTVHKSKGLEFPVVILGSLEQDKFPMKYDEKREKNDWFNGSPNYYTPAKYLKYKINDPKLEEKTHYMEENRIVYVAMTRAEDLLIISSIPHKKSKPEDEGFTPKILNNMKNETNISKLDFTNLDNIEFTESRIKEEENKVVNLYYSNFVDYNDCPHKYSLLYNYLFKISDTSDITYGLVVHDVLNKIHKKAKKSSIEGIELSKMIDKVFKSNPNIELNDVNTEKVMNNIKEYWSKYGSKYEIIGSEIPFNIRKDNYELTGQIDLLVKKEDGSIKLIDFKNTMSDKVKATRDYYAKQIYIYTLALRENPDYNNYTISEGEIFAMQDVTPVNIPLNDDKIDITKIKLQKTACGIMCNDFHQVKSYCGRCQFEGKACKGRD